VNEVGWLVAAAVLVVVAGLASMIEASLSYLSLARVQEMAREGRGTKSLVAVVTDLHRHLSVLVLLRLAAGTTATVIVSVTTVGLWGLAWHTSLVAAVTMTIVAYVFVAEGPRTIGRNHAYLVGLASAGFVRWLGRVLGLAARLLSLLSAALTPGRGLREGPIATETELRELVDIAEQRGVVEHDERDMIHSVFELGSTIARELMVPRTEVVWIEREKTVSQALSLALRSGFSRIPVLGDGIDDIVGIVYLKDMVRRINGKPETRSFRVEQVMRAPEFVPESKLATDLLREMQARRIHMAVVIDEYGGTAGLITIEDILEEIVGEITDEYDNERSPVERLEEGRVRVTARLTVEDLGDLFGLDLATHDVESVGGLMAQALGRVPIPGATVQVQGLELTAESAGGRRNRIDTVLVRHVPEQDPAAG
jgi:CBS domain containing-hemolysin-like protein